MRLKQKLLLFTLGAIIIPMLLIAVFSSIQIYKNSIKAQQEILNEVVGKLKSNIVSIQDNYSRALKELSQNAYLQDKLSFYTKYWDEIEPVTLDSDIMPFREEVEKFALSKDIESIAVYRKNYDSYKKVIVIGKSDYVPDEIFPESKEKYFDNAFNLFSRSLYMNTLISVYRNNREVGLILMQKTFDKQYFTNAVIQYGIDVAVQVRGRFIFSTFPNIESSQQVLSGSINDSKINTYQYNGKQYNLFLYPFDFGKTIQGRLYAGLQQSYFSGRNNPVNFQMVLLTFFCVIIPVITFYFWGSQLIKSIQRLVSATNAVSAGNYNYRIEAISSDELGHLSNDFNNMILALKRNNEMLERNNKDLTLLNNYIDAVFHSLMVNTLVIDRDYKIVLANQSARSELKFPESITDLSFFSVSFFASHKEYLEKTLYGIFMDGKPNAIDRLQNGRKIYSVNLFPIKDKNTQINGIILVIIDITENLTLENAVVKTEKLAAVGRFAADVAHEVGNPMAIILNHVQLIATGKLSSKEEKEYIKRVETEIKRINSLIEKLLNFSRDESLNICQIHLSEFIKQMLDLFEPKLKKMKIKSSLDVYTENLLILGNLDSLKQVFFNIINNAIQSIHHQHGEISVKIEEDREFIRVDISDNGVGIKNEFLEKVFDPFFTNKSKHNTGLGLPLSYKIIRRQHGNITIASEWKKGTVVSVYLLNGEKL